jgi:hypothetical protein
MAGRFFSLHLHIFLFIIIRLHAGVSTVEPQTRQAIPFSAFIDAVEDYEADSETDDEGDMMNA